MNNITKIIILCFFVFATYTLQGQTKWQGNYYHKKYLRNRKVDCSVLETIVRNPFNVSHFAFWTVENIYIVEQELGRNFWNCDSFYYEYKLIRDCDSCIVIKNRVIIVDDIKKVPNIDESCILLVKAEKLSKKIIIVEYQRYNKPELYVKKLLKRKRKGYEVVFFSYA